MNKSIRPIWIFWIIFFVVSIHFSNRVQNTTKEPLLKAAQVSLLWLNYLDETKEFPKNYYGFNTNILGGPAWQDPKFIELMHKFSPQLMRYPGGTVANYWDWKKGFVLDNLPDDTPLGLKNMRMKVSATLDEFKIAVDAIGFKPIFVLNMETSDLDYQMEMLRYAQSIGLEVSYIELGNEFYFQHTRNLRNKFPSGKVYAEVSNRWAMKIKEEFSDALIAVHGLIDPRSATEKPKNNVMEEWNYSMKEIVEESLWIDAVALHIYIPNGIKNQDELKSSDGLQNAINQSYLGLEAFKQTKLKLPSNKKIWLTEFNLMDQYQTLHSRWIHGISVGIQLLSYLEMDKIEIILYHSLIGRSDFTAFFKDSDGLYFGYPELKTKPWSLSAAGIVLREVFNSMQNAEKYQTIALHDHSFLNSLNHGVIAYCFSNKSMQNIALINPTSKMLTIHLPENRSISPWIHQEVYAEPMQVIYNDEKNIFYRNHEAFELVRVQPYSLNVFSITEKSADSEGDHLLLPRYQINSLNNVKKN